MFAIRLGVPEMEDLRPDLPTRLWGTSWYDGSEDGSGTGQSYPYWKGNGILIAKSSTVEVIGSDSQGNPISGATNLDKIMPGDIIYYAKEGDDGSSVNHPGRHCMVVLDNTRDGTITVTLSDIKKIESTSGSKYGEIKNNKTIADIATDRKWFVVRLNK